MNKIKNKRKTVKNKTIFGSNFYRIYSKKEMMKFVEEDRVKKRN